MKDFSRLLEYDCDSFVLFYLFIKIRVRSLKRKIISAENRVERKFQHIFCMNLSTSVICRGTKGKNGKTRVLQLNWIPKIIYTANDVS